MAEYFEATHRLKKKYVNGNEVHKKGSPVTIPKGNKGFNGNVFFITSTGRIRSNRDHVVCAYSKSFFKPRKEWFEKIQC